MKQQLESETIESGKIISLDCELAGYRKGSLTVSLNLQNGTLTWRDSRQWCNDFIRSLNNEQVDALRNLIRRSGLLEIQEDPAEESENTPAGSGMIVTITLPDRQIILSAEKISHAGWNMLRLEIEKLSRMPFCL